MKNKLLVALMLVLVLIFATFAACHPVEDEQFTVTFAGEGITTAAQTIVSGGTAIDPKTPEREGYTFKYWYTTDQNVPFSFDTPITGDITLNAFWEKNEDPNPTPTPTPTHDEITGSGTSADPYVLYKAAHLTEIAKLVNDGDEAYVKACYKLGADIDLDGIAYTPIGTFDHPFEGKFDGDGKKISNLAIKPIIRSDGNKFYGLFGMTEKAVVRNIELEDIDIDVSSYRDGGNVTAYIGGVAGYASLTTFENVSVSGKIATFLMADNGANIGGIAGWCANASNEQAYIVYLENCFADIEIGISEQDGEKGSLENGRVGGLFGVIYNQNCSVAVINCAVNGAVYGGQYTGGITGYINGLTTIINCYNAAAVTATAQEVSYAGGIVGSALDDNLIIDCVSIGDVSAPKAGPNTYNYKSRAGAVAGYAESDDYTNYFSAGTSIVNCYYAADATGADVISKYGSKYALSYLNKLENLVTRVNWTAACWTTDNGVIKPTDKTAEAIAENGKYVLTLQNGAASQKIDKSVGGNTGYSLVGELDDISANDGNLFWAWELTSNVQYKFYMPVIKDITLTARWQDVTAIAKAYKGTGTLHETYDAGSIVLNPNGTLQWINDSAIGGTYRFDGTHILMEINNNIGTVSGTISGNTIIFQVDAGMTGTVDYEFVAYEPKVIGEYISENGNLLTFTGDNRVSYENAEINGGDYVSGTYQAAGNTLTPTFRNLSGIVAGNIELQNDGAVVFHFTQGGVAKTETFTKLGVIDYSDKGFVGQYNYVWVSSTTFVEKRQIRFDADGTATLITPYAETPGRYYYIQSTGSLKVIIEGNVSDFKYDAAEGVIYGIFSRGGTTKRPIVLSKIARGAIEGYSNYGSSNNASGADIVFVFQVADGKCYSFVNNNYATYNAGSILAEGSEVTLQGTTYRINGIELRKVGAEAGAYTYGNMQITLDGVNSAVITGQNAGSYYYIAHADNVVTIVLDTSVIAFDYTQAKANNNVVATPSTDGAEGVWYSERLENPYYYRLVIDGFGHATVMYMPQGENYYKLNWGSWGTYVATNYGAVVRFNDSNKNIRFVYYYDGNFAYTADAFGGSSDYAFIAKGYTGATTPPAFPTDKAGSYVSQQGDEQLVLNIRADLSGTYRGNPISNVIYDGQGKIFFTCNTVNYTFTLTQSGGTLDYGATPIDFVSAGAITEVIPSALCGLWSGIFEGYGASDKQARGFLLESDGTVYYYSNVATGDRTQVSNVKYDFATYTVTFTDATDFHWTLVYNIESKEIAAIGKNDENTTLSATLTLTEQQ